MHSTLIFIEVYCTKNLSLLALELRTLVFYGCIYFESLEFSEIKTISLYINYSVFYSF